MVLVSLRSEVAHNVLMLEVFEQNNLPLQRGELDVGQQLGVASGLAYHNLLPFFVDTFLW